MEVNLLVEPFPQCTPYMYMYTDYISRAQKFANSCIYIYMYIYKIVVCMAWPFTVLISPYKTLNYVVTIAKYERFEWDYYNF